MGVIKDGTISGNLPNNAVFAVHYPGYPSSVSRAVQTLGGFEAIDKARKSECNKLELRFRPEDPYSHPAFGELRPCNNLLLRISRKKSSDGQNNELSNKELEHLSSGVCHSEGESVATAEELQIPDENHVNLSADIVAQVSEAYHFDGMADYQHVVAVHADVARRKKRTWSDVEEPCSDDGGFVDLDQDDVMMILPPLFAPKDMPENLVLQKSATLNSIKGDERTVLKQPEMDIESGLQIDFNVKEIPEKVNWKEYVSEGSKEWQWQMVVSKLFDERPIWPKSSIIDRLLDKGLQLQHRTLKRLLLGIAYYFSNGPFLRFWIRKGYDPRKDPESRIYQRIDFRVKPPLRSYCEENEDLELRWRDICSFKVFPTKCSTSLQLYELDDDDIQKEIRKPARQTTCSLKTGWFSETTLDILRKCIEVRFLMVYPREGAEKLLKSTKSKLKKLKEKSVHKDAKSSEQEEHQHVNKDKEESEGDEGNDNDKIEVDDAEEESDAYEAEEDMDDEISRQSHSCILPLCVCVYIFHNSCLCLLCIHPFHIEFILSSIFSGFGVGFPMRFSDLDLANDSTTYLQDLFGSFPSAEVNCDKLHGDGISDEEYQIYEQESDDNGFDEDDN